MDKIVFLLQDKETIEKLAADEKMHEAGYKWDADKKELKKIEQKPAQWSEEDEKAIGIIKMALEHPYDMDGKWDRQFALDWLKHIKEQVIPKTEQEWSEEDEKHFNKCLELLIAQTENISIEDIHEKWESTIDWLKSLRPQNHWKPSEEQIDALLYVYQNITPPLSDELGWESVKTIELMYHQLKKL